MLLARPRLRVLAATVERVSFERRVAQGDTRLIDLDPPLLKDDRIGREQFLLLVLDVSTEPDDVVWAVVVHDLVELLHAERLAQVVEVLVEGEDQLGVAVPRDRVALKDVRYSLLQ